MIHHYSFFSNDLNFRPLTQNDLEMIRTWRNSDRIRTAFIDQSIISPLQQQEWFNRYRERENDFMFVIEEKTLSKPIGTVSVYDIDFLKKDAQFGRLFIGENSAIGKGYGRQIVESVLEFSRKTLNLNRIYLEVLRENERAYRLYENLGFRIENTLQKNGLHLFYMTKYLG